MWEFLLHHLRQYIAELSLKGVHPNAIFSKLGPRLFAFEEFLLSSVSIECGIVQFRLARISDHQPAKLEFMFLAY